jgi:hypothetical protein
MRFVVDGLDVFADRLSAVKPKLAEPLRRSIANARAQLDPIPPQ